MKWINWLIAIIVALLRIRPDSKEKQIKKLEAERDKYIKEMSSTCTSARFTELSQRVWDINRRIDNLRARV
jgi:hypothetical protein